LKFSIVSRESNFVQQIETKKQIEFDEFKRHNRALGEFGGMKRRLAWRRGIKEAERCDLFCWEGVGRWVGWSGVCGTSQTAAAALDWRLTPDTRVAVRTLRRAGHQLTRFEAATRIVSPPRAQVCVRAKNARFPERARRAQIFI
jgi:hypothetical protein